MQMPYPVQEVKPKKKKKKKKAKKDPYTQQAEMMLDGIMGDQAGLFKDVIQKLGVDDKEFWKGAMLGAAAALLFSNENVRTSIVSLFTGAGGMLATSGSKAKETATNAASNVKESVVMGSDIFKDTVSAGKQGFEESVTKQTTRRRSRSKKTRGARQ